MRQDRWDEGVKATEESITIKKSLQTVKVFVATKTSKPHASRALHITGLDH
jgi:hypothetical protein